MLPLLCALACACNPPCTGDDTEKPPSDPQPEPWEDFAVSEDRVCWSSTGKVQCIVYDVQSGPRTDNVQTLAEGSFHDLAGADDSICALTDDGEARCWGGNGWGETDVAEGMFEQLSPGYDHVCALDAQGAVTCWGGYVGMPL